jgi:predicted esterase
VRLVPLALALALAAPALAQQQPPAEDKQSEYQRRFAEGLDALHRRDLKRGEAAFKRCLELFPEQPVVHYNLACTYSLAEKPDEAVTFLRQAYERGFVDLSHVGRDTDLDAVRRTPQFRALLTDLEQRTLASVGPALRHVPEPAVAGAPILVWIHDQGGLPQSDLDGLRSIFPGWVILAPQGRPGPRQGLVWDDRVEFVVVERLRALRAELKLDDPETRRRTFVVGDGAAGALAVLVAAQHPDLFGGVLAAGPRLHVALADVEPSGLRAYLVVRRDAPEEVEAGVSARDALVRAGSAVVLERYPLPKPLEKDRAVLVRGLGWLKGDAVKLPGAGVEQSF